MSCTPLRARWLLQPYTQQFPVSL